MPAETAPRSRAWLLLAALTVAFLALAAALTPWDATSGLTIDRPPAEEFFTPEQVERSEAYHDAIRWAGWLSLATSLVLAGLIGFSRLGRALIGWVTSRTHRWWLQVGLLVLLVLALQRLVTLPFSIWGRVVRRDYGLSTDTWAAWAGDLAKSFGISLLLTSLGLVAVVGLARRFPRYWFVPAAGGAAGIVLGLSFLYPVVIEPVFNDFTSMPDGPLRTRLVQLADEDGIEVSDVLVADASRRTTALNAYVSGFGATKRIVVYDTLVAGAPDDEIELIVAHELAHARYDDVLVGTTLGAVGAGLAVTALYLVVGSARVRRPLAVQSVGAPAVVPLVLALATFATFASAPIQNTLSRQVETRADTHSLELTGDPETFVSIQQRLAVRNISHLDPNPVLAFWFSSHPTTLDRIGLAQAYEQAGERVEP